MALLEVTNVKKIYSTRFGGNKVQALFNVTFSVEEGEYVAIMGESGSGKTTLLNILAALDRPTSGEVLLEGKSITHLTEKEISAFRRKNLGFVFQDFNLLDTLTAYENISLALSIAGTKPSEIEQRIPQIAQALNIQDVLGKYPYQMSGGQQQRVAAARAMVTNPAIVLADEPTGALDKNSGIEVMRILRELNAKGHTIILVTHDHNVAKNATRIIEISDGSIISDLPNTPENADELPAKQPLLRPEQKRISSWRSAADRLGEAFRMALLAMNAHRMRTFLTMLGIIIGIASVVSVVALGNGSQKQILENISSLGTNTITVYQGRGFGDNSRSSQVKTLIPADARSEEHTSELRPMPRRWPNSPM